MSAEAQEKPIAEKRGRGRPKGSTTKNRIREDSILVPSPIRRPRHYNQSEAAAELGISHAFLYQLAKEEGGIFKPAAKNGRHIIYTDTQIEIISLVMRKKITAERGLSYWKGIEDEELISLARRMRGGDK